MSRSLSGRQQAYARACARGLHHRLAFLEAGYKPTSYYDWELRRHPVVTARIEELKAEYAMDGSSDLTPVIAQLMRMASHLETGEMTISAITAAKGILLEAARLKERLPTPTRSYAAPDPDPDQLLAHEAWRATFR